MARFYRENQGVDNHELKDLEEGLDYTPMEISHQGPIL
jgi:hypothetical protein